MRLRLNVTGSASQLHCYLAESEFRYNNCVSKKRREFQKHINALLRP
jgi:hypothetical protein